eukprot:snap_masked-scaffold_4-processed-gene-13.47-mRNA-1 protein AED:1.00 eAED:1.00 QI:0/-1/0/0/-1/1/1/0/164
MTSSFEEESIENLHNHIRPRFDVFKAKIAFQDVLKHNQKIKHSTRGLPRLKRSTRASTESLASNYLPTPKYMGRCIDCTRPLNSKEECTKCNVSFSDIRLTPSKRKGKQRDKARRRKEKAKPRHNNISFDSESEFGKEDKREKLKKKKRKEKKKKTKKRISLSI